MKVKYILAVVITAIVTLSFTFISTSKPAESKIEAKSVSNDAPVGGIAADDSF